jgi:hypothetical protein
MEKYKLNIEEYRLIGQISWHYVFRAGRTRPPENKPFFSKSGWNSGAKCRKPVLRFAGGKWKDIQV